jgi:hypothetical protein
MKKNLSYPQQEVVESQIKIKPTEWFVVDQIANLALLDKTPKQLIDNKLYIQFELADVINQLPALELSRDNLKKMIVKLVKMSFLLRGAKNKGSKKVWYAIGHPYLVIVGLLPNDQSQCTGKKFSKYEENFLQSEGNISPTGGKILSKNGENFPSNPSPHLFLSNTKNTNLNTHVDESVSNEKKEMNLNDLNNEIAQELRRQKLEQCQITLKSFALSQTQIDTIFKNCRDEVLFNTVYSMQLQRENPKIKNFAAYVWSVFKSKMES